MANNKNRKNSTKLIGNLYVEDKFTQLEDIMGQ